MIMNKHTGESHIFLHPQAEQKAEIQGDIIKHGVIEIKRRWVCRS